MIVGGIPADREKELLKASVAQSQLGYHHGWAALVLPKRHVNLQLFLPLGCSPLQPREEEPHGLWGQILTVEAGGAKASGTLESRRSLRRTASGPQRSSEPSLHCWAG